MATATAFDPKDLESKVKTMYRSVAENPHGEFHFEMGRGMAERLGYSPADLDRIPAESIESFAGVGYYFHMAELRPGDIVVDLGSGSGMDTFIAALKVDARGKVTGVDMTDEQRAKAQRLRDRDGFLNVTYLKGYIEDVPLPDNCADAVISNGVINLATDKSKVFREAARLLRKGGRFAIADIVTEVQLPETIVCNSTHRTGISRQRWQWMGSGGRTSGWTASSPPTPRSLLARSRSPSCTGSVRSRSSWC